MKKYNRKWHKPPYNVVPLVLDKPFWVTKHERVLNEGKERDAGQG